MNTKTHTQLVTAATWVNEEMNELLSALASQDDIATYDALFDALGVVVMALDAASAQPGQRTVMMEALRLYDKRQLDAGRRVDVPHRKAISAVIDLLLSRVDAVGISGRILDRRADAR